MLLENATPFAQFVNLSVPPVRTSLHAAALAEGTAFTQELVEGFNKVIIPFL
jgi:hypothetical protein